MIYIFHRLKNELSNALHSAEYASLWETHHKVRTEAESSLAAVEDHLKNAHAHLAEIRRQFKEMDAQMDPAEAARLGEAREE